MRGLKVAHQNVDDVIMLELDLRRTLKGVNVTPYDQAIKEEELGVTKKIPCACCLQKFLYVNLPLKVSEKAIIDIRVKWTGGMTSQSVWSDTLKAIVTTTFETSSSSSYHEDTSQFTSPTKRGKLYVNTKKIPDITPIKVYSDVRVCLFCSQFFQFQESYRPSFADMVKAEKRAGISSILSLLYPLPSNLTRLYLPTNPPPPLTLPSALDISATRTFGS